MKLKTRIPGSLDHLFRIGPRGKTFLRSGDRVYFWDARDDETEKGTLVEIVRFSGIRIKIRFLVDYHPKYEGRNYNKNQETDVASDKLYWDKQNSFSAERIREYIANKPKFPI